MVFQSMLQKKGLDDGGSGERAVKMGTIWLEQTQSGPGVSPTGLL